MGDGFRNSGQEEQYSQKDRLAPLAGFTEEMKILLPQLPKDMHEDPLFAGLIEDSSGDVDTFVKRQMAWYEKHLGPTRQEWAQQKVTEGLRLLRTIAGTVLGEEEAQRLIQEGRHNARVQEAGQAVPTPEDSTEKQGSLTVENAHPDAGTSSEARHETGVEPLATRIKGLQKDVGILWRYLPPEAKQEPVFGDIQDTANGNVDGYVAQRIASYQKVLGPERQQWGQEQVTHELETLRELSGLVLGKERSLQILESHRQIEAAARLKGVRSDINKLHERGPDST